MDAAHLPAPQLGRILIAAGLLTEEQLAQALEEQAQTGRRLGEIIVERGFISGPALANALAEQHGGVLKTEYGFASGLGGVVARRAAAESGATVSSLRPPDPAPFPPLRTAEEQPQPAGPRDEQAPVAPVHPLAPVEPEPLDLRPLGPPPLEEEPQAPVVEPTSLSTSEMEPTPSSEAVELEPEPEQTPPTEVEEPLPEPVNLHPAWPPPLEEEPQAPAEPTLLTPLEPEAAPSSEDEPAVPARDDRDDLIDSLRARVEAQEHEIADLRSRLGEERAPEEMQVHAWPEEQPVAPSVVQEAEHYLLCVPTPKGYVLLDRVGGLPTVGAVVEVPEEEGRFTVTKVVRLPRNGRPCAYLQQA